MFIVRHFSSLLSIIPKPIRGHPPQPDRSETPLQPDCLFLFPRDAVHAVQRRRCEGDALALFSETLKADGADASVAAVSRLIGKLDLDLRGATLMQLKPSWKARRNRISPSAEPWLTAAVRRVIRGNPVDEHVSLPPVGKRCILRGPCMWTNISPDSVETDVRL